MSGHASGTWKRLGDGSLPTEEQDEGLGHIVPLSVYNSVFASLLLFTALTVWAATQHFGILNLVVALTIATVKAALVTLYFMHLNWESRTYWIIVIYPLFIFALIVGGTLGDEMAKQATAPGHAETELESMTHRDMAAIQQRLEEAHAKSAAEHGHPLEGHGVKVEEHSSEAPAGEHH